jgi:hypothetical protein
MRTTRAIYDSLSLSYRPFQSDGRACEHACKYGYLDFFFYVYVSRDDRMAVTKRGENCNRERDRRNWTVLIFWNDRIQKRKDKCKIFIFLYYRLIMKLLNIEHNLFNYLIIKITGLLDVQYRIILHQISILFFKVIHQLILLILKYKST